MNFNFTEEKPDNGQLCIIYIDKVPMIGRYIAAKDEFKVINLEGDDYLFGRNDIECFFPIKEPFEDKCDKCNEEKMWIFGYPLVKICMCTLGGS